MDHRAFAFFALYAKMSAVLMNDAITSRESESASFLIGLGGEERFEKVRFHLFTHSNASIGNINDDKFSGDALTAGEGKPGSRVQVANAGFDRELAAFGHRIARVYR